MADRETLIARKQMVRRQIERVQRELAQVEALPRPDQRRIRKLQDQLDRLMGEEYTLRLAIDRSA